MLITPPVSLKMPSWVSCGEKQRVNGESPAAWAGIAGSEICWSGMERNSVLEAVLLM